MLAVAQASLYVQGRLPREQQTPELSLIKKSVIGVPAVCRGLRIRLPWLALLQRRGFDPHKLSRLKDPVLPQPWHPLQLGFNPWSRNLRTGAAIKTGSHKTHKKSTRIAVD